MKSSFTDLAFPTLALDIIKWSVCVLACEHIGREDYEISHTTEEEYRVLPADSGIRLFLEGSLPLKKSPDNPSSKLKFRPWVIIYKVEDKAIIYSLFFPLAKSDPTWTKHRVAHKACGINKKPFTTRDILTWTGSIGDQEGPWPRSVTSTALRMGAGLRSPQEGEPTSKFVVEGAAQVAAPVQF
ncbi:hypothetical protein NC653_012938 [Populus alba x Populus x berolinensis]|uniref:Uncharacterized protein n=1 Tax=Populus alba x Populus x berolinensis TaxID=444605 RepID=A0AAD6QTM2_9ROSI|nr:hypothetical protein NC653_012938 [Populus alba x Populus x berolinensis]